MNEEVNKIKYFSCMDKIICISENTKKDLIEHYRLSLELIDVVHSGVSFDKSYINNESTMHETESVVYDEQMFSDLIIKGRNNIKNFSWEKCAEQTLKVHNSIL